MPKFKPIDHLTKDEEEVLIKTRESIKVASSQEELNYLESILDLLLKLAFSRYKKQ